MASHRRIADSTRALVTSILFITAITVLAQEVLPRPHESKRRQDSQPLSKMSQGSVYSLTRLLYVLDTKD